MSFERCRVERVDLEDIVHGAIGVCVSLVEIGEFAGGLVFGDDFDIAHMEIATYARD